MTSPMMLKLMTLSLFVITIGANEVLMKKECSSTDLPTVCLNCLKSNASSYSSDLAGFARISAYCLESELKLLAINVTLTAVKEVEPIKKVLDDCYNSLSITSLKVRNVESSLVTSDYDLALKSLKTALFEPLTCGENLYSLKYTRSPQIYAQIIAYAKSCKVVSNLVQRLIKFI